MMIKIGKTVFLTILSASIFIVASTQTVYSSDALDTTIQKKSFLFKKGNSFICDMTQDTFPNALIVDKEFGWSIFEYKYFRKGDVLMHINNCYKVKKIKRVKSSWDIL